MIKRWISDELQNWKTRKNRKPLILRGARQVGKTTIVKQFSHGFDAFIYLNLELKSNKNIFEKTDDIHKIINEIFIQFNIVDPSQKILVFIDEIQESQKAINLLRYFYEEYPALYVIAAGSLLEFALNDTNRIPVGRVEYLVVHPINFAEYLRKSNAKAYQAFNQVPYNETAYEILMKYFHEYALVGGMPEITANYISSKIIATCFPLYESILQTYFEDVEKYSMNKSMQLVILHIMNYLAYETDKRVTFQNFGNSNYKSREVGEAFNMLQKAGLLFLIYPTTQQEFPGIQNFSRSPRLQMLDTGLVNYKLGLHQELVNIDDIANIHKGKLIQHLVVQEYISTQKYPSYTPMFWVRENKDSNAEVDLVEARKNLLIPVEIKSGAEGRLRSLHQFMDSCPHFYAVRLHANNLEIKKLETPKGKPFLLMNLPYFLGTRLNEYIDWFVENNPKPTQI